MIIFIFRETEAQLTDRLHKEKRSREEEARQMQERAADMIQELEKELEAMRGSMSKVTVLIIIKLHVSYGNR